MTGTNRECHCGIVLREAYICAVQNIVTKLKTPAASPQNSHGPGIRFGNPPANQKILAGINVMIANTPSRDNHEERHCDKARHARSGCPKCAVEDKSPAVIKIKASVIIVRLNDVFNGSQPNVANKPKSASIP